LRPPPLKKEEDVMSVTAKEVVEIALGLAGHVGAAGTIDKNREARCYGVAPSFLTMLQCELAAYENAPVPQPVGSLSQLIELSDETARKVLPAGLAMYFALLDRDAVLYNHFKSCYYGSLAPSVKAAETTLAECYLTPGDPMMR
jgi:hypothetical protein